MDWLEVVMEEYKTLRNESLIALQTQQSTLRFGLAITGLLIVSAFNLWEKELIPELIFLFFVPLSSYLSLIIWMGEVARMMRAGTYITELEEKVNKGLFRKDENKKELNNEDRALDWENWLRTSKEDDKTPQLLWNYKAIIILFLLLALTAIFVGNYIVFSSLNMDNVLLIDIQKLFYVFLVNVAEFLAFSGVLLFVFFQARTFK